MIDIMLVSVIVLVAAVIGLISLLAIAANDIKFRLQAMKAKKKGYGLVGITGNNYIEKFYWRQLTDKAEIKGNTYLLLPKFMTRQKGIPTYHFYEGDARPIDMMKKGRDKLISPELFSNIIIKAKAAGMMPGKTPKDLMFYLTIASAGASIFCLLLVFNISSEWGDIIRQIPALCGA